MKDLKHSQALSALKHMRKIFSSHVESEDVYKTVISTVGGRLSYLRNAASQPDMLKYTRQLVHMEKAWLLSQIGLVTDHEGEDLHQVHGLSGSGGVLSMAANVAGTAET